MPPDLIQTNPMTIVERKVNFKGMAVDCLRHFVKHFNEPALHLSRMTGADQNSTVGRWIRHNQLPKGEYLLKVLFFLNALGYQVTEIDRIDSTIRAFAELVAWGVLEIKKAEKSLGYTARNNMLGTLMGRRGVSNDRRDKMAKDVKAWQRMLPKKIKNFGLPDPKDASQDASTNGAENQELILQTFAGLIKTMLPLAKQLNSSTTTPQDRAKLREMTGDDGVFKLSNQLHRLCSETARRNIP